MRSRVSSCRINNSAASRPWLGVADDARDASGRLKSPRRSARRRPADSAMFGGCVLGLPGAQRHSRARGAHVIPLQNRRGAPPNPRAPRGGPRNPRSDGAEPGNLAKNKTERAATCAVQGRWIQTWPATKVFSPEPRLASGREAAADIC